MPKYSKFHTGTLAAYGLFMATWSLLEIVIEVAIAKQLSIGFLEGNIITSGMGYEQRASILRSLLARHSPEFDDVRALLTEVTRDARRNTMAHGHIRVSETTIEFIKRSTKERLTATKAEFSTVGMVQHLDVLNQRIKVIQSRLGVTDHDLEAFAKIGHHLTNKLDASGNAQT